MDRTGCDVFVDVHGDETLPVTFLAGSEGCKVWGPRHEALHGAFVGAYARANPEMQARFGYEASEYGTGNLAVCSNQIGQRFDCLAATLEMPFKDSACVPRPKGSAKGFGGEAAAGLGHSLLDALAHVASQLRGVDAPAFDAPDDAYVAPVEDMEEIAAWMKERQVD